MKFTAIILILLALHVSIAATASSKTKTTASKTSTTATTTNSTKTTNSTQPPALNGTSNSTNGTMGPPPRNSTNNGTMGPPPGNGSLNGTNGTLPMDPPPARNYTNSSRLLTIQNEESEESLLPDGFYDIAEEDPSKKDDTVSEEELGDELPPMKRKGRPLDMPPPEPRGRKELPKMRGSGNFRRSN